MEGDLTWDGEHNTNTDDVLQNCTPETYIILYVSDHQLSERCKLKPQ